jgi:hypothetical protein
MGTEDGSHNLTKLVRVLLALVDSSEGIGRIKVKQAVTDGCWDDGADNGVAM